MTASMVSTASRRVTGVERFRPYVGMSLPPATSDQALWPGCCVCAACAIASGIIPATTINSKIAVSDHDLSTRHIRSDAPLMFDIWLPNNKTKRV